MSERTTISRRAFLKAVAAVGTVATLDQILPASTVVAQGNIDNRATDLNQTQCAPAAPVTDECPKSIAFRIYGEQFTKKVEGDTVVSDSRTAEGPVGVDLRLSLRQDPEHTRLWGTFKPGERSDKGFTTLIQMGPTINNGTEHGKPKLDLLGDRFEIAGCYKYDTEALVQECIGEVLRPAWLVDVERIVKENGQRVFRYEFSFPVSPDCNDAEREYIDTRIIVPTTPAIVTPTPVTPAINTGTPGRQPAQLPRSGDGSTPLNQERPGNPIPRMPGN